MVAIRINEFRSWMNDANFILRVSLICTRFQTYLDAFRRYNYSFGMWQHVYTTDGVRIVGSAIEILKLVDGRIDGVGKRENGILFPEKKQNSWLYWFSDIRRHRRRPSKNYRLQIRVDYIDPVWNSGATKGVWGGGVLGSRSPSPLEYF